VVGTKGLGTASNAAYFFAYGGWFTAIKWTRTATSVACPWPYPEAKVYDPQGFYEKNGQPGPYAVGIWSTWMTGQPQNGFDDADAMIGVRHPLTSTGAVRSCTGKTA
jgi:hypothetical protein